jgi:uncharacterized zinc-type alcohol dehydrogenase-like protein
MAIDARTTRSSHVVSADQVNDAWERVLASDVRYRFVIDDATLEER